MLRTVSQGPEWCLQIASFCLVNTHSSFYYHKQQRQATIRVDWLIGAVQNRTCTDKRITVIFPFWTGNWETVTNKCEWKKTKNKKNEISDNHGINRALCHRSVWLHINLAHSIKITESVYKNRMRPQLPEYQHQSPLLIQYLFFMI